VSAGFGSIVVGSPEGCGEGFEGEPVTPVQVEATSDRVTYEPKENVRVTAFVKNNGNDSLEKLTASFTFKDALGAKIHSASKIIDRIEGRAGETVSITWKAGELMPRGYVVDVDVEADGESLGKGRVIFDVAEWTQVPRYGFFAIYGYEGTNPSPSEKYIDKKVADLAKFHINSVQFYDWFELHGNYAPPRKGVYQIKGLDNYNDAEKVSEKLSEAQKRGMKCMAYVVVYAVADVVFEGHPDWALTDESGVPLPFGGEEFRLQYVYPGRECGWHDYAMDQFVKSMRIFGWDGIHIDQYDSMYKSYWNSREVDLVKPFIDFVDDAREAVRKVNPKAAVVFNSISKKPLQLIESSTEDFVYVETWITPSYEDVAGMIRSCRDISGGKAVVLAAYTPKDSSKPTILLLDAVIFANQGFHIELGEGNCVLADSYFPRYDELPTEVVEALRNYYGHITRYEEYIYGSDVERLERGAVVKGRPFSTVVEADKIYVVNYRRVEDGEPTELIFHLVNFKGVSVMDWHTAEQAVPTELKGVGVEVPLPQGKGVAAVYLASPDEGDGDPEQLGFMEEGGFVRFRVPRLSYWSTVIVKLK